MVFSLLIFLVRIIGDIRRQFRSPTFRQYGQMKSRDGKSQRREKKKEDQRQQKSEERRSRCAKR
jgi:Na+-transporting methylmalonyl-CoA/oxaloacetate decarboxylase gamma subunit